MVFVGTAERNLVFPLFGGDAVVVYHIVEETYVASLWEFVRTCMNDNEFKELFDINKDDWLDIDDTDYALELLAEKLGCEMSDCSIISEIVDKLWEGDYIVLYEADDDMIRILKIAYL